MTIDSEVEQILDDAYRLGKTDAALPSAKDYPTIMPKMKAKANNILAQEANKARLETMQKVSDKLDDLHQGTEGAGWVHYGEVGEWLDDEISRLTADKEQADG